MSWWICSECDYVFEAEAPPETCPECHSKCVFSDVTCYIPECGGPGSGNLNPEVFRKKGDPDK